MHSLRRLVASQALQRAQAVTPLSQAGIVLAMGPMQAACYPAVCPPVHYCPDSRSVAQVAKPGSSRLWSQRGAGVSGAGFKNVRGQLSQLWRDVLPFADCVRGQSTAAAASSLVEVGGLTISREAVVREDDPTNNVPDSVFSKIGVQLHRRDDHPLGIIKNEIYRYFDDKHPGLFQKFEDQSPIVSVKANFDDVLVPKDHVSRSYNDTYYINSETVLRCHTSAHQAEMLRNGETHFLVTGDVYRRDAIDATHYPVFHQMEGFRVFYPADWEGSGLDGVAYAVKDLKDTLEGLAKRLFGDVEMRWVDTYFPFTDPSFELEIFFKGKWLEVLGSGITEQEILKNNGRDGTVAWAFGLGLERLAMVLFDIPDIRLFWSSDQRFTSQFKAEQLGIKFKPFSKFPPCYKDISFWISDTFTENNLCEVVRGIAGDLVEEVSLIDNFTNKKGMTSHCYRIAYRSMERSLTDEEINGFQARVRDEVQSKLNVTLR